MRVLFANTIYPTTEHPKFGGGAETFSTHLCEALVDRGHAVQVVRSGDAWASWEREVINGVDVATLPIYNLYSPWQNRSPNPLVRAVWHLVEDRSPAAPRFDSIMRDFQPDVLHSNNFPGLTVGIWSKAKAHGVPIVHTLHDYYLTCVRSLRFKNGSRCLATCGSCELLTRRRRRVTPLVDTVVSVSDRTLEIHHDCGLFNGDKRQTVIRNPPSRIKGAVAVAGYGDDLIVFGFIGRPSIEKGIFELVSAFREIPRDRARLLVAGNTDKAMRAQLLADGRGADIRFLGFVKPEAFFRQIDVMVIPSIWEDPCPMVIGESFAYGRPVVGACRGGIPELISDENAGWLYEPGRDELGPLLTAIASNRQVLAAKSSYLVSKTFERRVDDLVSDYLSVYQDTVEHHDRMHPKAARPLPAR